MKLTKLCVIFRHFKMTLIYMNKNAKIFSIMSIYVGNTHCTHWSD